MARWLIAVLLLTAACDNSPEMLGTPKGKLTSKSQPSSEPDDKSVLGDYYQFGRPPQNLLLRRAPRPPTDPEPPPPLTGKHLGAVYDLVEFSLQTQLTESQKKQLRDIVIAEYEAGGDRREGVLSAPLAWTAMQQVYEKAPTPAERNDLLPKNRELFIKGLENSPDYPYRRALEAIVKTTDQIVAPGPPALTQQHVESLLEATEFLASVYLGKPFTFLVEDREAVAGAIVEAYKNLPDAVRGLFVAQERHPDVLWTILRGQWMNMDRTQRDSFRTTLVDLFGYPVFQGNTGDGAVALLALPDAALSAEIRHLFVPKLPQILEQLQDLPIPIPEMMGYVIYDY